SDAYRSRDDKTKVIFGEPGSKFPGLIDSQPKIKRAKRGDDSYGIHVYGTLQAPKYEPWTTDEATAGAGRKKGSAAASKEDADDAADDADDADEPAARAPFRRNRTRERTTPPARTAPRTTPPARAAIEERQPPRAE